MNIYIKANSKKSVNERLAGGEHVEGTIHSMMRSQVASLKDCPSGTVVKIFSKYVGGQPYAKAYGIWDSVKNKIK